MKPILAVALFLISMGTRAQLTSGSLSYGGNTVWYWQFKPAGYDPNSSHHFPLIISLGGVGERGNGPDDLYKIMQAGLMLQINAGNNMQFTYNGQTESFVVLSPQLSTSFDNWQEFYIDAMIDYAKANLNIDPNRIFLTGFSLGGGGAWKYATSSAARAANLAGIIPVSASPDWYPGGFCNIAQNQVAVWSFHSGDDPLIDPNLARGAINSVNSCSPLVPARLHMYPDGSHAIWNARSYDTSNYWQYPNVYQWMMKVSRAINVATDVPPVANAGPNIVLNVPVRDQDIVLNGLASSDADDIVSEYRWQKTGGTGPSSLYFLSPVGWGTSDTMDRPTATVVRYANQSTDWMDLGTYIFTLQVKDYKSQVSTTTVTYTIQIPPGQNGQPGAYIYNNNVTLNSTQNSTGFFGVGKDWDGPNPSLQWTQLSGPATTTLSGADGPALSISNISTPGTYTYRLRATDNLGATGDAIATVTKLAALPVAYAYFRGESAGSGNLLSWATTQEINSDHFDILRSADGRQFVAIGTVGATGAANGSAYHYTDANAPQGKSYYRLQQVDRDGKSTMSDIVTIDNAGRGFTIGAWPNPAKDNLSVTINGNLYGRLHILVTDMQGRIVQQELWTKTQMIFRKDIHINGLQSGLYQLILVSPDGTKETRGFVKY